MAEWFKAAVLKTVVGLHPTGGSNPSLSALILRIRVIVWSRAVLVGITVASHRDEFEWGKVAEWLKARPC